MFHPSRSLLSILAAGLFALAIAAGVFIYVTTPYGTVKVTVAGKDAGLVRVTAAETIEITDPNDGKTIEIRVDPEERLLRFKKDGFRGFAERFDVRTKNGRLIKVAFQPLPAKPSVAALRPVVAGTSSSTTNSASPAQTAASVSNPPSYPPGELVYEQTWDNEKDRDNQSNLSIWGVKAGAQFTELKPTGASRGTYENYGTGTGANCAVETRVKIEHGQFRLLFAGVKHEAQVHQLDLQLDSDGAWRLFRVVAPSALGTPKQRNTLHSSERGNAPWARGNWVALRVESAGEKVKVFIDGSLLAEVTNPFVPPQGAPPETHAVWTGIHGLKSDPGTPRRVLDHLRVWKTPAPPAQPGRTLITSATYDDPAKDGLEKGDERQFGQSAGQWRLTEFAGTKTSGGGHPIGGPTAYDFESEIRFRFRGGRPFLMFRLAKEVDQDVERKLELSFPGKPDLAWEVRRLVTTNVGGQNRLDASRLAPAAAGSPPVVRENEWNVVKSQAHGRDIDIEVNGRLLARFRDDERKASLKPYRTALEFGLIQANEHVEGQFDVDHLYVWRLEASPRDSGQITDGRSIDAVREFAQWGRESGAIIEVLSGDQVIPLAKDDPLPTGSFTLRRVDLSPSTVPIDDVLDRLSAIDSLSLFHAMGRPFTDDHLRRLQQMRFSRQLFALNLTGTKITDAGLDALRLFRLTNLHLEELGISDGGLAPLADSDLGTV